MDIDTSSYPKVAQVAQQSPLEMAAKFGALKQQQQQIESGGLHIQSQKQGLQSNDLNIANQKLDLINKQFATVSKQMIGLRDKPDLTEKDLVNFYQYGVKAGWMPSDVAAKEINQIPPKANSQQLRDYVDQQLTKAMTTMEAVNYHLGQPTSVDNGQTVTPALTSPKFGIRPNGAPIQTQAPPTTNVATPGGTQQLGAQAPQLPVDTAPVQDGFPGQYQQPRALPVGPINNPAIQGPSSNLGGTVLSAVVEPPSGPKPIVPQGPMQSQPPMFDEGKKQLTEDQDLATAKLTAIKPALQALPYLQGLQTGPGTHQVNNLLAAAKAFGIVNTNPNDPVAIRQEVEKKLAQYLSSNPVGQRSDNAQTLASAGSPNPSVQINPALIKLTKDAIVLDRVQAARAAAFEGNDYSKYGIHRSTFPVRMDERAFGLDLMEPNERKALITDMKKKKDTTEGRKFWKSLETVDKLGYIDTSAQ